MGVQRTLVLIKPDAMARGLRDEILLRLDRLGCIRVTGRQFEPDRTRIETHYAKDEAWLRHAGDTCVSAMKAFDKDAYTFFGVHSRVEIGRLIHGWLIEFMLSGPVYGVVYEGANVILVVRKHLGNTVPFEAVPGTIRGDYGTDDVLSANGQGRSVHNLVHASGDPEEAAKEIGLWFPDINV